MLADECDWFEYWKNVSVDVSVDVSVVAVVADGVVVGAVGAVLVLLLFHNMISNLDAIEISQHWKK